MESFFVTPFFLKSVVLVFFVSTMEAQISGINEVKITNSLQNMDRKATSIAQNIQNFATVPCWYLVLGTWWTAGYEQPPPLFASLVRCAFVYILYFEQ